MKTTNRRTFLKSAAVSATAVSWSARSWAQVAGANSDVRYAVIGFNGRGRDHLGGLSKVKGCRLTGLCDVDSAVLDKERQAWAEKGLVTEAVTDLRKLLESKNVDAVSIATPNHWHSLAAIWAIQAGKDVYVEKPVSHNVFEGRKLVEAARKYQKIVQTGTQSRSSQGIREAVAWVRAGNLGRILVARGLCYKPRPSIGKVMEPQPPPATVNYDLWCGPAPMDPIRRQKFHYDWHWIWNYGNGDLGNQGIHQMDIARWFLGEMELSPRVLSVGGRLGYDDDGETANTQLVFHDYEKAPLVFEVRGLPDRKEAKAMSTYPAGTGGSVAVVVHCEGGYVVVPNYSSATAYDRDGSQIKKWSGSSDHYQNFINAVRSRKHTDLNADILEGHLSSGLCHTGNVSYRLGQPDSLPAMRGRLQRDIVKSEAFERMVDHLRANEVDLDLTKATLGVPLAMDAKAEKFVGNDAANLLLTREYRKPYVVPDVV